MSKQRPGLVSLLGACGALCFAACVATPDGGMPPEPKRTLPDSFGAAAGVDGGVPQLSAAQVIWSDYFTDPSLRTLIETALQGNQELNVRVQDVLLARYEVLARSGEYRPRVDVVAGLGVDKVGETTSQGVSDALHGVPENLDEYRLGLAASWELDVWRRLRNLKDAANARYLASVEGRNLLVTALVAEVAGSYYELTALDNQLDVLDRNIAIQQDALGVVRLEKEAARVTQLAVQRFEAEVLMNQSRRFDLQQRILETENRINFLLGRPPQPIARDSANFESSLPSVASAGPPSELLDNRPDIRRAELALQAAKLDVAAAKARFYPSLSLEAGIGLESYKSSRFFDTPGSLYHGVVAGLVAPLFNRRGIQAEYFSTIAEQWKATVEFEQTALRAYFEVANQVSLLSNLAQAYELQSRQVALLEDAVGVSTVLFRSARADYMEVLLTRRDALDAEMERIETRLRQKLAMVQVYRALGGGWRS